MAGVDGLQLACKLVRNGSWAPGESFDRVRGEVLWGSCLVRRKKHGTGGAVLRGLGGIDRMHRRVGIMGTGVWDSGAEVPSSSVNLNPELQASFPNSDTRGWVLSPAYIYDQNL